MLKSATLELAQLASGCQSLVLSPAQLLRLKPVKGLFEQMHDYDQTRPPRELDALVVYPFPSITCPMLTAVTCLISLSSGGGGGGGSGRHVHSFIWLLSVYPEDCKLHKGRDPAVTPVPGQHCAHAGQTFHLLEQQQSVEAIHDQDMLIQ